MFFDFFELWSMVDLFCDCFSDLFKQLFLLFNLTLFDFDFFPVDFF